MPVPTSQQKREAIGELADRCPAITAIWERGLGYATDAEVDALYLELCAFPRAPRPVHDPSEDRGAHP